MKKAVTVAEYQKYRDETGGCLNVVAVNYLLIDSVSKDTLIDGRAVIVQEDKDHVLGKHPSGNRYSSTVNAALDRITPTIKNFVIQRIENGEKALAAVGLPETSAKGDEQGRRLKAITWCVTDIDAEKHEVWVKGVI